MTTRLRPCFGFLARGGGTVYIFWGFLMWGSRPVWIIAALVFIGVGVCYIIGSCSVSAPPVYICGERPADAINTMLGAPAAAAALADVKQEA